MEEGGTPLPLFVPGWLLLGLSEGRGYPPPALMTPAPRLRGGGVGYPLNRKSRIFQAPPRLRGRGLSLGSFTLDEAPVS